MTGSATLDREVVNKGSEGARNIPIYLIDEAGDIALRAVQEKTPQFEQLCDSVKVEGILNSVLVRKITEHQKGPTGEIITDDDGNPVEYWTGRYMLCDGTQRLAAAKRCGLTEIPANVVNMSDVEALDKQIITNLVKVPQKNSEVTKQIARILSRNPSMTRQQLAAQLFQTESWVSDRLSLQKLHPEFIPYLDNESLNLLSAYALVKLEPDEQLKLKDEALTEEVPNFVARVKQRVKEVRDAKNSSRDSAETVFQPRQHVQKAQVLKDEYQLLHGEIAGNSRILDIIRKEGLDITEDIRQAVALTVAWVLNFDPVSQAEQARMEEERKRLAEEKRALLKAERERVKAAQAAKELADPTTL